MALLMFQHLTSSEILAYGTAFGVVVGSFGAAIVNIIVALRTNRNVKHGTAEVRAVSAKTDVIAGHVNSAASRSAEQIVALQNQLALMTAQLAERKEATALLTQSLGQAAAAKPDVVVAHVKRDVRRDDLPKEDA